MLSLASVWNSELICLCAEKGMNTAGHLPGIFGLNRFKNPPADFIILTQIKSCLLQVPLALIPLDLTSITVHLAVAPLGPGPGQRDPWWQPSRAQAGN